MKFLFSLARPVVVVLAFGVGCESESPPKSAPADVASTTVSTTTDVSPPKSTPKKVLGQKHLPPRVLELKQSGSPPMKAFIAAAQANIGINAAKEWENAANLAVKAREVPSALDLFQLAQRADPTYCGGFTGARLLAAEIGKPQIALMVLMSEMNCEGANKIVLRKEAERLQSLLVVEEHSAENEGKPKRPKRRPQTKKLPRE